MLNREILLKTQYIDLGCILNIFSQFSYNVSSGAEICSPGVFFQTSVDSVLHHGVASWVSTRQLGDIMQTHTPRIFSSHKVDKTLLFKHRELDTSITNDTNKCFCLCSLVGISCSCTGFLRPIKLCGVMARYYAERVTQKHSHLKQAWVFFAKTSAWSFPMPFSLEKVFHNIKSHVNPPITKLLFFVFINVVGCLFE